MTDYVWGSNTNVVFDRSFGFEMPDVNHTTKEFRHLASFASRGKPFDATKLPSIHKLTDTNAGFGKLPDFFHFNFFYISDRALEILREFDLGNTVIHPVTFTAQDGVQLEQGYSIISAQTSKRCLRPDDCMGVRKNEFGLYETPVLPKDDSICFGREALTGAALFHVETIGGLFLTADLVDRLKSAGLDKPFHLYRVRIA